MVGGGLLERDNELALLSKALGRLKSGHGGIVLIEGVAGIGKTALLTEARRQAGESGIEVLAGSGAELEQGFPYGVVRQLFEPALRSMTPGKRDEVMTGAAGLATELLGGATSTVLGGPDPSRMVHALYWVTANLAAQGSRVVAIDDVQWADEMSLRYLLYLGRRLEGFPVLLLVAGRPGEPGTDLVLADLAALDATVSLRPARLSMGALAALVEGTLGLPDDDFVAAAHVATGGVPFLVHELIAALGADGVAPTMAQAARVQDFAPATVARATVRRLAGPPDGAGPLARAVAVLGGTATLPRATELAGLSQPAAMAAFDALVGRHILQSASPPEFIHPIVRAAVYASLAPGARSDAHARAADLLAGEGADIDAVAGHLLRVEPAARKDVVSLLTDAAQHALARGAPESAADYLQRALHERVDRPERAVLLGELGLVEKVLRRPTAVATLGEARRLTDDVVARARLGVHLSDMLVNSGHWDQGLSVIESDLDSLGSANRSLSIRLSALWAAAISHDLARSSELGRRMPGLLSEAHDAGPEGRLILLMTAVYAAHGGEPAALVHQLVQQGLDGGRFLEDEGPESTGFGQAIGALVTVDALDLAGDLVEECALVARTRGSTLGTTRALTYATQVQTRKGDLLGAEAELRAAIELNNEERIDFVLPTLLWYAADAIVERPSLDEVAELVESIELPASMNGTILDAWLREVRGRIRLQGRNTVEGLGDLRVSERVVAGLGPVGPSLTGWRRALIRQLAPDDPAQARQLASDELAAAQRTGVTSWIGTALSLAGLVAATPDEAVDLLGEGERILASSPTRYEHARAAVELGSALRRTGQRTTARDQLRNGLALARRCGATRLASRAEDELALAGARPRRVALHGVAALTPAELRVARLAAQGLSNPEIAQALYVSLNTVESHLYRTYPKLEVTGRSDLADAFRAEAS